MDRAIGIIAANYDSENMRELTKRRTIASIPFGARYRMIDFSLSNMVNSGIVSIGVIIPSKSHSLLDHIGFGKNWTLDRKVGGLYLLPETEDRKNLSFLNYILQDLRTNKKFLLRAKEEYAVISGSHIVCNIDYQPALSLAKEQNADIVLIGSSSISERSINAGFTIDEDNTVTSISEDVMNGIPFLDTMVIKRELLLEWIKDDYEENILDIIKKNLHNWKVLSYEHTGYIGVISCVSNYFRCSQDLLSEQVQNELFRSEHSVLTKLHDKNPTLLGKESKVKNSVMHSGCEIHGAIENSIIFRDVKVDAGAEITNSIIMPGVHIGENVKIAYAIIDKNAILDENTSYIGSEENIKIIENV